MRRAFALLCCAALLSSWAAAQTKQTPAPEDVPVPVAGDLGLAGAACPDIARFLNARAAAAPSLSPDGRRSEEHTSELQSPCNLVCRRLLEKKNETQNSIPTGQTSTCGRDT